MINMTSVSAFRRILGSKVLLSKKTRSKSKSTHQSEKDVVKLEPLDEERAVVEVLERRLRQDVGSGSHVGREKMIRVFFQR